MKYTQKKSNRGFTVIEMITALSIASIMAAILLFNYRKFNQNADFQNVAQDVALLIRKAETEALAGKYPTLSTTQGNVPINWKPSYGVYADMTRNTFIYFFDRNNDGLYGAYGEPCGEGQSECLQEVPLPTHRIIKSICVYDNMSGQNPNCNHQQLSAVFKRPFPDTILRTKYDINNPDTFIQTGPATFTIGDTDLTSTLNVHVTTIGQISITNEGISPFSQ